MPLARPSPDSGGEPRELRRDPSVSRKVWLGQVLRRHLGFIALLAAGLVLRVLVLIAYPQAFWYVDSSRYLQFSYGWHPDFGRQAGYSLFLKAVRQTGSLYTVSILQHLLGLAIAVAVYAFLQRRSVPRWLSVLAVTPILLDAFQLDIEHLVLAEMVFTTLIVAGLLALVWPARPSARSAGAAGLLLALSTTLRTVSLPLVLITAAYLIVRRLGWRPTVAYAVGAAIPLLCYVAWLHHSYGQYGFSTIRGTFMYGRVAPIADSDRLQLTSAQRALCPAQPVGERPIRSDWYIWSPDSPARDVDMETQQGFAMAVITQQPGTVARAIATDVAKFLVPNTVEPDWVCVTEGYLLPAEPPGPDYDWCRPNLRQAFSGRGNAATIPGPSPLTRALGGYAHLVQTPRLVLGTSVILVLAALLWRPRRRVDDRRVSDIVLIGGWGLGLIVLGVTGSMFDERYGLPSLAILPAAGALALHRLIAVRRRADLQR